MKTNFTEGPWSKDHRGENLINPDGVAITVWCSGLSHGKRTVEHEANAHLIAAAPAMYAMIISLARELQMAIEEVNLWRMKEVTNQTENQPDLWDMQSLHEAQLLLKKARGE